VVREEPVEQRGVAVLQRREADVLRERVGLDPDMTQLQLHLLLDGQHPVGQQATQVEGVTLIVGERGLLGQHPSAQEPLAALRDGRGPPGDDVLERSAEGSHDVPARC
jgi:hypothetical protein